MAAAGGDFKGTAVSGLVQHIGEIGFRGSAGIDFALIKRLERDAAAQTGAQ